MAGRLRKEDKLKPPTPEHQADADLFMKTIGKNYEELKVGYRANQLKSNKPWSEDVFQDTILLCYETIQRRGIRDKTDQGIRNYFFNSLKMNTLHEKVAPFNTRRVDDENIINNHNPPDECEAHEKARMQLYNDFATLKILELAEANCDTTSFYCFRLKHLLPKMSYRKLVQITNIKNAKARVKSVIDWVKENVTESELIEEYEKTIGDDFEL